MKKNHLLALALGAGLIATAGNAPAAIVSIDTGKLLPDSVGQAFSFDGTSLSYPAIVGECFRIQPNPDEFGPGYATDLMSWNTDNYHITAAPINFNASVMGADPQTGQLPRLTGPEDNVYYGLSRSRRRPPSLSELPAIPRCAPGTRRRVLCPGPDDPPPGKPEGSHGFPEPRWCARCSHCPQAGRIHSTSRGLATWTRGDKDCIRTFLPDARTWTGVERQEPLLNYLPTLRADAFAPAFGSRIKIQS